MREIKFISPTSLAKFMQDRDEYYLIYLADNRVPRLPQTQPMAIGAALDAYAKSYLHEKLFGAGHKDSNKFSFETIFESQVEAHNRDWARKHGAYAFGCYRESGAIADMLSQLHSAGEEPRFEFTVEGNVAHTSVVSGIPFLGKPDIWFVTEAGTNVILDMKVNGFCSKSGVSPKPGYVMIRDGSNQESRGRNKAHKNCEMYYVDGIPVNIADTLENVSTEWATQLSIYAWLLGADVGSKFVVGIDQLVCKPNGTDYPDIRVAEHRMRIGQDYQISVIEMAAHMWRVVHSGHIFDDVDREASDRRCESLDKYYLDYEGDDKKELWFREVTKAPFMGS